MADTDVKATMLAQARDTREFLYSRARLRVRGVGLIIDFSMVGSCDSGFTGSRPKIQEICCPSGQVPSDV